MPWKRKGKCVFKITKSGGRGEKQGCSKSAAAAKKYVKALYANANDVAEVTQKQDFILDAVNEVVSALPMDMSGLLFVEVSMRTLSTSVSVTKRVVTRPRFPEQSLNFQTALWKEGLPVGSGFGVVSFYASRMRLSWPLQVPINDWVFHQVEIGRASCRERV